ncbi:hypothetical protein [uncultured Microscilla sp.]|uniref:hypothetical protein n=1 Tax=uncultured Microscilla sp. TaxID=432653 RepID=UPI00262B1DA5|nr:hypothetical protein [uncultured Microscilla sp.]
MLRTFVFLLLGVCFVCFRVLGQDVALNQMLQKYYLNIDVTRPVSEISGKMKQNKYLSIEQDTSKTDFGDFVLVKSGSFNRHPLIKVLGFDSGLALHTLNGTKLVSLVLHFRFNNLKVYKKLCRRIKKDLKKHFQDIKVEKKQLSFSVIKNISFFKHKHDDQPLLTLSMRQTFIDLSRPKESVYSLTLTYQE